MKRVILLLLGTLIGLVGIVNATPVEILDAKGQKVLRQGSEIFQTYWIKASVEGDKARVQVGTNLPPSLISADLIFREKDKDGRILMAFKMGDARIIPFPKMLTSQFLESEGLASRYADNRLFIPVLARGDSVATGMINSTENTDPFLKGNYIYTAEIPLAAFPKEGIYSVEYATAGCGNSVVRTTVYIPPTKDPEICWGGGSPGIFMAPAGCPPATFVSYSSGSSGSFGGGGGGGAGCFYQPECNHIIPPIIIPPIIPPFYPPCPPPHPPAPLPGTLLLVGSCLAGLALTGRK